MKIEKLKLSEITPYINNAKEHPQEQIDQIKGSIKEFGFNDPIAIDENNVIIEGHGRYIALQQLGVEEVEVIRLDHLSEIQKKQYIIAHNKLTMNTGFNLEKLKLELKEIEINEKDLSLTGFEIEELKDLNIGSLEIEIDEFKEDEPPEVDLEKEPYSKLGDLYMLGSHRLLCGDSTKVEDVTKVMLTDKADLVFTDPPWNVNYGGVKEDNPQGYKPRTILNDFMGTEDFKKFMFDAFSRMAEFSKKGCPTYVVMSAQEWGNMMLTLAQNNYHWSSTVIWNKDSLVLSRKDYHTKYEPIWYGWLEGAPRLHPLEDRKQCDVWDIPRPKKSELHPTTKPIEVPGRAIMNSSKRGDVVLDLFGGSGSTMMACDQLERKNRSLELDPRYVDVIVKRYINLGKEDVILLRDGKEISYSEIISNL
ncbi:site-specific DNA-methyltransferase [Cetobacterium sp.]|uniref:site-specific DNA-methyltransferase n=1 Tax=Cetobacterium sp. TaxID=2071632 RepID=UPI003F2B8445